VPIHVQRAERAAVARPDYLPDWVEFEGATYVEHDGEAEIVPGVRVVPTPGHSPGHQSVLVETDDGLVVVAGDVGHTWAQFDGSPAGQALMALRPRRIWLSHVAEPRDLGA
jgi:N-acyl homoserine lactone hydrolase